MEAQVGLPAMGPLVWIVGALGAAGAGLGAGLGAAALAAGAAARGAGAPRGPSGFFAAPPSPLGGALALGAGPPLAPGPRTRALSFRPSSSLPSNFAAAASASALT